MLDRRWVVVFISTAPDGTAPVTAYYGEPDEASARLLAARLAAMGAYRGRSVSCECWPLLDAAPDALGGHGA